MLDIQLLHLTQTARCSAPGRKRMKRKEHARTNFTSAACNLPCWDPQRRCWCYPINLLSWDILAVRYGCLMLLNAACEPSVCMRMQLTAWYPGLLGNSMMMTLSSTEQPEQPYTFNKTNGTSDATLQPAHEMSVALFFFNGCLLYRFNSCSPDEVSEIINVWPEPVFSEEILLLV